MKNNTDFKHKRTQNWDCVTHRKLYKTRKQISDVTLNLSNLASFSWLTLLFELLRVIHEFSSKAGNLAFWPRFCSKKSVFLGHIDGLVFFGPCSKKMWCSSGDSNLFFGKWGIFWSFFVKIFFELHTKNWTFWAPNKKLKIVSSN